MDKPRLGHAFVRFLLLTAAVALPPTLALGHEGHQVECNDTAINAVSADIQAMEVA